MMRRGNLLRRFSFFIFRWVFQPIFTFVTDCLGITL
ncbi:hypothetical protein DSW25_07915 [Sulfitobacter donghicola DSW-25 = KCTC 12864 = JCM 14565]|uniref:Uncharacterized protein n=1 Tax=Sulfitobacter donghicola DSW-25 = KCTC 12864 = JCM 14565 TaxID=1300350 RepID=A0A073ILE4_9RHOB|nr:hypothetical protein DSW25_07915 [Sulfitobacter donghicola DSW-25 = KCTC 12864 = JCM 14565]